jgi:ketosteroid isomerase-like protein
LVFVEGPRWATLSYDNVAKGWHDFVDADISVQECNWIEHLQSKVVGNMGFLAGIIELKTTIAGKQKTIKFRGTFVFEKNENDEWKVIHEHFSQPAEDPYGIGDWLKKD